MAELFDAARVVSPVHQIQAQPVASVALQLEVLGVGLKTIRTRAF